MVELAPLGAPVSTSQDMLNISIQKGLAPLGAPVSTGSDMLEAYQIRKELAPLGAPVSLGTSRKSSWPHEYLKM